MSVENQTSGRHVMWLVAVLLLVSLSCGLPSNLTGGGTGSGGTTGPVQPVSEGGVRLATVRSAEGVVEARIPPATDFSPVSPGETLAAGDEIRTGADGRSVLELDDGTVIVLAEGTSLVITALEGTPASPVTRYFLNVGEIFSIREDPLPPGGTYEVETAAGTAGIRGTAMSAAHRPEEGFSEVTCAFGECSATSGTDQIDLAGNEWIGITIAAGFAGDPAPLTPEQLQRWSEAFQDAENAGLGGPFDARCACDARDLTCDDGTRIPEFPYCTAPSPGGGPPEPEAPGGQPPTPSAAPQVVDFSGTWHSDATCDEAEDAPYRWEVALDQDEFGTVTGSIRFHDCPDGGRANYSVTGTATEEDTITLFGLLTDSRGGLGGRASPDQSFTLERGGPPEPNLAP